MYNTSNILSIKKAHCDRKCDQRAEKACEFSYFLRFMLGHPSMVSQFYHGKAVIDTWVEKNVP